MIIGEEQVIDGTVLDQCYCFHPAVTKGGDRIIMIIGEEQAKLLMVLC